MTSRNLVTGDLIRTFPQFQLYNSDSKERTVGIWRYGGGGIIHPAYYEYATESIGPYKYRDRYGYVVRFFYEKSTPPIWRLYDELLATKTGLVAMFVNNSFICIVYPDAMKYIDIDTGDVDVFKFEEGEFKYKDMMDVGWVRTYPHCFQVSSLPYRLQMNLETGYVYIGHNNWVVPDGFPKKQDGVDYPMYKRLLEQPESKVAVMYDVINEKEVYL